MAVLRELKPRLFGLFCCFKNDLVCFGDLFLGATGAEVVSLGFLVGDDLRFVSRFRRLGSGFSHCRRLFLLLPSHRDRLFSRNVKHAQGWSTRDRRHLQLETVATHLLTTVS